MSFDVNTVISKATSVTIGKVMIAAPHPAEDFTQLLLFDVFAWSLRILVVTCRTVQHLQYTVY
jgi:hypothetical protein